MTGKKEEMPTGFKSIEQEFSYLKFEEMPTLTGVFTGFRTTTFGESAIVKNGEATYSLPTLTVLNNLLKNLEIGTEVFISYKGEKVGNSGTKFKDFSVAVKEDDLPF